METRFVANEEDRKNLVNFVKAHAVPFMATISKGDRRSLAQNRLQRMLCNEISSQWEGHSPEEVRGYCKLHYGIPLLRAENEVFREKYDRLLKRMTYEDKLEIMQEPIDVPVTRIMTREQKTRYLDTIYQEFTKKGFILTRPEDGS